MIQKITCNNDGIDQPVCSDYIGEVQYKMPFGKDSYAQEVITSGSISDDIVISTILINNFHFPIRMMQ